VLGRPADVYNLLKVLRPDLFINFFDFGLRYTNPKNSTYGVDWTGSSNERELHLLLEKTLMIRRLKSEVLQELPSKRRQKVSVPIDRKAITAI